MKRCLVIAILLSGLALLMLEIALRYFPVQTYLPTPAVTLEKPFVHYTPNHPYIYSTGWRFDAPNDGRTNAQGYIADIDFDNAGDKKLIAIIGDSFIEARGVQFRDTAQERLARLVQDKYRVYGFGMDGAGLSQYLATAAMLRDHYKPSFLIVNIVSDDFEGSMPRYQNDPRFHYFFKVNSGGMRPLMIDQYKPSPVVSAIMQSALVRYVYFHLGFKAVTDKIAFWMRSKPGYALSAAEDHEDARSERLRYAITAVNEFLNLLPYYAGLPKNRIVLVVDGMRREIYNAAADSAAAKESDFEYMRDFLILHGRTQGYDVVDLHPAFAADYAKRGYSFDIPHDGHWNTLGHGMAAGEIRQSKNLRAYLRQSQGAR